MVSVPRGAPIGGASLTDHIESFKTVFLTCRFPALTVVAALGGLLLAAQGRELAVRLVDEGEIAAWIVFYVTLVWWATVTWLWARTMLNAEFGTRQLPLGLTGFLVRHVPRLLSLVPFAVAALSLYSVPKRLAWIHCGVVIALALLLYIFFVKRHDLARQLQLSRSNTVKMLSRPFVGSGPVEKEQSAPQLIAQISGPISATRSLLTVSPWPLGIHLSFVAVIIFGGWAVISPLSFGWTLGLPAGAFVAFSTIVPVGSYIVYLGSLARVPAVSLMLVLALLFSLINDNHAVRALTGAGSDWHNGRPDLKTAIPDWAAKCLPEKLIHQEPVVVVATAGGGIRAAYWTATVLGEIHDRLARQGVNFAHRVAAISGVSGGSLGATVYLDLLRQDGVHCEAPAKQGTNYAGRGQDALAEDFLSPVTAALLFGDILQRFLPVGFIPDRAAAHERSFEDSFARTNELQFGKSFGELWRDGKAPAIRPALFLNGTHQETGRRIITSNLRVAADELIDAYDFFNVANHDIAASTAVLNSARFTYVSPAGTLRNASACNGGNCGHIVDGGYFENYGAVTAAEVMNRTYLALYKERDIRPVVIQISSDPELDTGDAARCDVTAAPGFQPGGSLANDLWAPIGTLFNTRTARGLLAAGELKRLNCGEKERGPVFVHFRMCDAFPAAPLGWVLARASKENMKSRMLAACGNDKEMETLIAALTQLNPAVPPPRN